MSARRSVLAAVVFASGAVVAALLAPVAQAAPSATGLANMNERVCATPALGSAACDAIRHVTAEPAGKGSGHKPGAPSSPPPVSYGAADLQAAYGLSGAAATAGAGNTVAIVDAYDDPNAAADLAAYRAAEGLGSIGACDTANVSACTGPWFAKVNQSGVQGADPAPNASWSQEISVDVDMVSAICPKCNILLVEANSANIDDLGAAVNTAAGFNPVAIGNSYGGSEFSGEQGAPSAYYAHAGIAITASSGDSGYGVEFPAAASSVIAVGGTSLRQDTGGSWIETAWSGSGSGCSAYIAKPGWQQDSGCANRTVADVAADADPNTGVDVYDSYNEPGWMVFGGTSVAAQIIAAVYGLAGNGVSDASSLYTVGAGLTDVTSGSDGSCTGHGRHVDTSLAYLCTAGPGYDGPTGMGTPFGTSAF